MNSEIGVPDGGWGWAVVTGTAIINVFNQSLLSMFGLIFGVKLQNLAGTTGVTTVMSVNCTITNFSGFLISPLSKLFSTRQITQIGVFLVASGLLLSGYTNSYIRIMLGYGVLTGLGLGLIASSTFLIINSYFDKNKSQAVGLAMAGTSVGQMGMPPVVASLLENFGYNGTTLILAGLSLNGFVGAMFFEPVKKHLRFKNKEDNPSRNGGLLSKFSFTRDKAREDTRTNRDLNDETPLSETGIGVETGGEEELLETAEDVIMRNKNVTDGRVDQDEASEMEMIDGRSTTEEDGKMLGQMTEPEPEFLAPLENHTVTQGRDVYFTCVVNHLSTYKVAWIKSDTKAILAIHTHMVAQNPRLSVTHNGHNTWKLHVSNVQKNDSGTYMCQINTDPMRSQMGHLEVVIPPDILNDNESAEGSGVAVEGGTIRLHCYATGIPDPTVLWRREDSSNIVLRHDGGREKQVLRSFDGETLTLTNVHRTDMGAYLCIASNGVPPSVSKRLIVRVHFHPLIRVSNQLVAAPIASDVVVQCYVEASPKAMNHWMRDNGEKLIPNDKYVMEETKLNEYSLLMNLTIRNLEKKDFGGYICTSSNALGKAEGVVRLQELHLPVKSTSTASTPRFMDTKPRKIPNKDKPKKYKQQKKKESSDNRNDEEHEMTTLLLPELRTQSPSQTSAPSATRSTPWNHHRNNAASLPFEISCYIFIPHVMFQLFTVYMEIV